MKHAKWGFVVWVTVWSSFAFAYIPPSQFILKTWVAQHSTAGMKGLRIRSLVTAIEKDKPTPIHFKETTWVDLSSMILKSVAVDDQDQKLFRSEREGATASLAARFLLGSDLQALTQMLREKGVPIRTESELVQLRTENERRKSEIEELKRWNGRLAWVIGGQLWMEKDSFMPLRLIYTAPSETQVTDIRFEGVRYLREFPYPRTTQLVKNGSWLLSSQLIDMAIDNEWGAGHVGHSAAPQGEWTPSGEVLSVDLKSLIQLYYANLR